MAANNILLEAKNIKTHFFTREGVVVAVDDVSFHINKKETLGIVGESGCGKSITSYSIMRLIPKPGRIVGGEVIFERVDLFSIREKEMQKIRGKQISMIFQEPMTSLNPVLSIGRQISEIIQLHLKASQQQALKRAKEMLQLVGIPNPDRILSNFPHQLSGGMQQRVMIATSLSCNPKLLIADEPTTALDVTIQAQILELMRKMKEELGMAIIFITHDLGVIAEMADRVVVMYAGRVVEEASVGLLFKKPLHPYTKGLLNSLPSLEGDRGTLYMIEGDVPDPMNHPVGCRFFPRCSSAFDQCTAREPALFSQGEGRYVRCWLHENSGGRVGV